MAYGLPNYATAAFSAQAQPDAVDFDILAAAYNRTGVVSGCAVTAQGTPDMTLAVAAGQVAVAGTLANVTAGNVTITAAHATLNRFDLVTVNNAGTKAVTAGTTNADPVFPAIPANSAVLVAVYVPAADTAIGATQITDKRVVLGGLTVVKRKASNTSRNTTTTQTDDPDLLIPIAANDIWVYEISLIASGTTTGDISMTMTAPAGATLDASFLVYDSGTTGGPANVYLLSQAAGAAGLPTSGAFGFRLWGMVSNGATAGNLALKWAQAVSNASNSTLEAGSYLLAIKV